MSKRTDEVLEKLGNSYNFKKTIEEFVNEYIDLKDAQKESDGKEHPSRRLGFGDKEYGLECLADSYIFHSLNEFKSCVQGGEYTSSDGGGELVFVDTHTFQLRQEGDCWDVNWDRSIEEIIKNHSDSGKQLLAVMWYNK